MKPSEDFYNKNKNKSKALLRFKIQEKLVLSDFSKKELIYIFEIINNIKN